MEEHVEWVAALRVSEGGERSSVEAEVKLRMESLGRRRREEEGEGEGESCLDDLSFLEKAAARRRMEELCRYRRWASEDAERQVHEERV